MTRDFRVVDGVCHVLLAYDVGQWIDLDAGPARLARPAHRVRFRHRPRGPAAPRLESAPLRVTQEIEPLVVGARRTTAQVEAVLFDFAAVSLTYAIPFDGSLRDLAALSEMLYEEEPLEADGRQRVAALAETLGDAVTGPELAPFVEDYVLFHFRRTEPVLPVPTLLADHAQQLARILRAEEEPLAQEEVEDALRCRISFGPEDVTILDWNNAIVLDEDADEVRSVLEFANVQLLEMRWLDSRLDRDLEEAYESPIRRLPLGPRAKDLQRIGQMQVDAAILFERVRNALKLLGDQFFARLYRLAAGRFQLAEWDASIQRKLDTLDSIHGKVNDHAAQRRLEILEWMIVLLIALEIVLASLVW